MLKNDIIHVGSFPFVSESSIARSSIVTSICIEGQWFVISDRPLPRITHPQQIANLNKAVENVKVSQREEVTKPRVGFV